MRAVHALGAEHQVRKRQREQRANLLARPVVTERGAAGRPAGFAVDQK